MRRWFFSVLSLFLLSAVEAKAREVSYSGGEIPVYVTPGEPTQIVFPEEISGGFKRKHAALSLERRENSLIVFAHPEIPYEGEAVLVFLANDQSFALRILPADDDNPRDWYVRINDNRDSYQSNERHDQDPRMKVAGFPHPSTVPGLMRELVLRAEFGKRSSIEGYRRSNRYVGEVVLDDGTLEVKVDEIVLGSKYWGYILQVENRLQTGQKLNPATFRLDGTRAISAKRWELSARPTTAEQRIAEGHISKIYVVTEAHKRKRLRAEPHRGDDNDRPAVGAYQLS